MQAPATAAAESDAPEGAAHLGAMIDGWTCRAVLGRGGVATVYIATNGEAEAALKVMHPELCENAVLRDGFIAEARTLALVQHAGAVAVLGQGTTTDNCPYYLMERLAGSTLDQLVATRGGRLPHTEALVLAEQLLDVLQAYHEAGVVHRDVKPSNVFVLPDGSVKLLDFGAARVAGQPDAAAATGSRLGTPAYMAPEQAVNATRGIDARSDIFALGATLFRVISGQRPRDTDSGDAAFILAATTRPPSIARFAPELPLSVIRLIDRSMAWTPADRFPGAAAMATIVRQVLDAGEALHPGLADRSELRSLLGQRVADDEDTWDESRKEARRVALRDLFRVMSGVFGTSMQYSWDHEQCAQRRDAAWAFLQEAMSEFGNGLSWQLSPYSFDYQGVTIWEPDAAQDSIPYHLFSSGFREIKLLRGLGREEFEALLHLMRTDPVRDLPPEDDLATVYQERGFAHVEAALVSSFDIELLLEKVEIQDELAALRRQVAEELSADLDERAEVAEMAADVGAAGIREADALAQELENSAMDVLHPPTDSSIHPEDLPAAAAALADVSDFADRTSTVLAAAIVEADEHGDLMLLAEPMRDRLTELTTAEDEDGLLGLLRGIAPPLGETRLSSLLAATLTPDSCGLLLQALRRQLERADQDPALARLLDAMPRERFPTRFSVWCEAPDSPLGQRLRARLVEHGAGFERSIGERLPDADAARGEALLQLLVDLGTDEATQAMTRVTRNENETLRARALEHTVRIPSEVVSRDIEALLQSDDAAVRSRVLDVLATHKPPGIGHRLIDRIRDPATHKRPLIERQRLFMVLFEVSLADGERLATSIVRRHGLFPDPQLDASRMLAVELLGTYSSSDEALSAARSAARRWWWNTTELRERASAAATAIAARRSPPTEGG